MSGSNDAKGCRSDVVKTLFFVSAGLISGVIGAKVNAYFLPYRPPVSIVDSAPKEEAEKYSLADQSMRRYADGALPPWLQIQGKVYFQAARELHEEIEDALLDEKDLADAFYKLYLRTPELQNPLMAPAITEQLSELPPSLWEPYIADLKRLAASRRELRKAKPSDGD